MLAIKVRLAGSTLESWRFDSSLSGEPTGGFYLYTHSKPEYDYEFATGFHGYCIYCEKQ